MNALPSNLGINGVLSNHAGFMKGGGGGVGQKNMTSHPDTSTSESYHLASPASSLM